MVAIVTKITGVDFLLSKVTCLVVVTPAAIVTKVTVIH